MCIARQVSKKRHTDSAIKAGKHQGHVPFNMWRHSKEWDNKRLHLKGCSEHALHKRLQARNTAASGPLPGSTWSPYHQTARGYNGKGQDVFGITSCPSCTSFWPSACNCIFVPFSVCEIVYCSFLIRQLRGLQRWLRMTCLDGAYRSWSA